MDAIRRWAKLFLYHSHRAGLGARGRLARRAVAGLDRAAEGEGSRGSTWLALWLIYSFKRWVQDSIRERRPLFPPSPWRTLEIRSAFAFKLAQWADLPPGWGPDPYAAYVRNNALSSVEAASMRDRAAAFEFRPLVSILVPVYNSRPEWLERLVASIRGQTYDRWELVLVDDASPNEATKSWLQRISDARIVVERSPVNGGVVAATNRAAELASGEFLAFVDHDDELLPDALWSIVERLQRAQDADLLYTNEEVVPPANGGDKRRKAHPYPMFKPGFSPELLLAFNYICHLLVLRRTVFDAVGGLQPGTDGAQDFDLILRSLPHLRRVEHVDRVLYRWHAVPESISRSSDAGTGAVRMRSSMDAVTRRVVQAHIDRLGLAADAEIVGGWARPRFRSVDRGRASIVVCTRDNPQDLLRAIASIEAKTDYPNYEIVIVDNGSETPEGLAVLDLVAKRHRVMRVENGPEGFNWSRLNNIAARTVDGDFLLFLNDDVEVLEENWLSAMVGTLAQPGVGVVGAWLEYPDGRVQHAGVVCGAMGWGPWHALMGERLRHPTDHRGLVAFPRNCIAVTGACLMTRRDVFLESGGFDEANLPVGFSDVDYCLRLHRMGLRCAYVPQARLVHFEGRSRGRRTNPAEALKLAKRSRGVLDPFWPRGYSREDHRLQIGSRRHARRLVHENGLRVAGVGPARSTAVVPSVPVLLDSLELQGRCTFQFYCTEDPDWERRLRTALAAGEFDVVLAENAASVAAVEIASELGVPSVWNITERLLLADQSPASEKRLLRVARALRLPYQTVYNNHYGRGWAQAGWLLENARIVDGVVPTVSPEASARRRRELRREWGASESDFLLGVLAEPGGEAAIDDLSKALTLLPNVVRERIHVVCVRAKTLPDSAANVVSVAEAPDDWPAGVDVFLAQPLREPRAAETLQALAHGVPLVGTWHVEHADLLHPDVTGLRVKPFHARNLAKAIQRLFEDESERKAMGRNARDWLATRTHPEDHLQTWAELLLEAAEVGLAGSRAAPAADQVTPSRARLCTG